ncbi:hypothetical protein B0I35DRAFT_406403 [Stachybotrys elegans]|uniref:Uncharacterized protein n=1 Tax=Stachybotrys elegans TaxID=80388 RepID=A0A8K0WV22_9HYPO|nr:hypothetical protein B0I35DRAFT_406403 [Stachybotrys elegans]
MAAGNEFLMPAAYSGRKPPMMTDIWSRLGNGRVHGRYHQQSRIFTIPIIIIIIVISNNRGRAGAVKEHAYASLIAMLTPTCAPSLAVRPPLGMQARSAYIWGMKAEIFRRCAGHGPGSGCMVWFGVATQNVQKGTKDSHRPHHPWDKDSLSSLVNALV